MRLAQIILAFASGLILGASIVVNMPTDEKVIIKRSKYSEPVVIERKKTSEIDTLINAIIQVESHGNDSAVNVSSQAVGCMQIRPIMVREANRILKIKGINEEYKLKDRYSRDKSIEIFHIWRDYHHKGHSWERIARCWNGGGKGHEMTATINYWKKVKSNI
jgi:hypothetical protein